MSRRSLSRLSPMVLWPCTAPADGFLTQIKPPPPAWVIYRRDGAAAVSPPPPRPQGGRGGWDGHGGWKEGDESLWSLSDLLNHPGVQRAEMAGLGALGMPCPHGLLSLHTFISWHWC